ncbi:MAG: hypothetical protein ACTS6A_01915, partial [Candidatus Hodgkinia cicadicola]
MFVGMPVILNTLVVSVLGHSSTIIILYSLNNRNMYITKRLHTFLCETNIMKFGRDLCIVAYDRMLWMEMTEETRLVGCADDVAALAA